MLSKQASRRINNAHLAMWRAKNPKFIQLWSNIYNALEVKNGRPPYRGL